MRRTIVTTLVVAATLALPSTAHAQTKVRADQTGDAPSFVDLTSVTVQNTRRTLGVTMRFVDVEHRRTSALVLVQPAADLGTSYSIASVPVGGGRHRTVLRRLAGDGPERRVRCDVRARWREGGRGLVRLTLPQRCLGTDAGRLRVLPVSYDKQRTRGFAVALRRGDVPSDPDSPVFGRNVDAPSVVTTRRGR